MTSTPRASSRVGELSHRQDNLDTLARVLPEWLLKADLAIRQSYSRSLRKAHQAGCAARKILEQIQPLDDFAAKLLREKLIERFAVAVDVRAVQLEHYIWQYPAQLVTTPAPVPTPQLAGSGSVLQMALQNFTAAQAQAAAVAPGSRVHLAQVDIAAIKPFELIGVCRDLDIGRRYQEHLAGVLAPQQPRATWAGEVTGRVLQALAATKACNLEIATQVAFMRKRISWAAYQMLLAVSEGADTALYGAQSVDCCQLVLHGHVLEGVLVLRQGQNVHPAQVPGHKRVLYVPDAAAGELHEFDDLPSLCVQLARQLKYTTFRQALTRHAPLHEQALLDRKLDAGIDGHVQEAPVSGALFEQLVKRQCRQRREDSLMLAVPSAQVDLARRQQLLESLESLGVQVLNLVSLFVPVLNAAMLTYTAYDLMSQVYHGLEDWTEDKTDEAMEHLVGVVETIAVGAVLGVGAHKVGKWVKSSDFFQALRPVELFNGDTRLWNPALDAYRQPLVLSGLDVSAQGRVQVAGVEYAVMDGHAYRVQQDASSGQWRILHPRRQGAWSPLLEHNAQGAWRHALERPWDWPSAEYAFRRLGPVAQGMDEADIAQVLRWADIDAAQLSQLHADNAPVPALLSQACAHWRLDRDIRTFISGLERLTVTDNSMAIQLLPHLPGWDPALTAKLAAWQHASLLAVLEDTLNPAQLNALGIMGERLEAAGRQKICELLVTQAHNRRQSLFDVCEQRNEPALQQGQLLRRDFPGLPVRLCEEVLSQSSHEQVTRMLRQARVPLAVAERARMSLARYRLLCVREGFEWSWRRNSRFEQMVVGLLEHLRGWPAGVRIELRAQSAGATLLAASGAADASSVKVLVKEAQGHFVINDQRLGETDLFAVLRPMLPAAVRGNDAQALARMLAALADADLGRAARLSGQAPAAGRFRLPRRLEDGRVGYPLSGRGAPGEPWQYLRERAKQLFARLTDAELTAYLQGLSTSGVDIARLLREKAEELASLQHMLNQWVEGGATAQASGAQRRRQRVADTFVMAWRRQTPRVFGDTGELRGYRLDLDGADLSVPPVFPMGVDFSHVQLLSLRDAGLTSIPNGFLDAFSRLRVLNLERNRLVELPPIIADMTQLEELHCADNDIQLTEQSAGLLSSLRRLEVLDLNRNPLEVAPDLRGLTGIRTLQLRFTSIGQFPLGYAELLRLELADFRDNHLTEIPAELYQSVLRPTRALYLQDNPLSASTRVDLEAYRQRTGINLGGLSDENEPGPQLFWARGSGDELVRERESKWHALRAEARSHEFFRILSQLSLTAEYDVARTELFDRVWRMIDAASADEQLRNKLFELAGHPRTCGNSVALNFSYLEIQVEVFRALAAADNTQVTARLLRLARGLFRLDQLDRVVLDDIKVRRESPGRRWNDVEEVEVSLGYRVRLAQTLDLPGQPSAMLFPDLEMVRPDQIESARQIIMAAETPAALADHLARQDFWCDWLRERNEPMFVELRESLAEDEHLLEERRVSMTDGDYYAEFSRLHLAFQEKTAALIQRLSQEALL